jgi:signal transduction histidine kinase
MQVDKPSVGSEALRTAALGSSLAERNASAQRVESAYQASLREFLAGGGEPSLLSAYELGREALERGISVLRAAEIHHRALAALWERDGAGAVLPSRLVAAQAFFAEFLSPFEMVHHASSEANTTLRRLNGMLEEQTRRIGEALHADAGQLLAVVYLLLAEAERAAPRAQTHFLRIRNHLDQMRVHLRNLAHELRPALLDDLGLFPALQFLATSIGQRSGIRIEVESFLGQRLNGETEIAIYRCVQDALSNAERHSRAREVLIQLSDVAGGMRCDIKDDGVGFDLAAVGHTGLGLSGMRERLAILGGTVQIDSAPGAGTRLGIFVPR